MAKHNELGQQGEFVAVNYLIDKGYKIIATNWRYNRVEVDIIAQDDTWLVFVEVKTRKSDMWGNPEDAINDNKIARIVNAADYYVNDNNSDLDIRFDVISLLKQQSGFVIEHFIDAFMSPLK